MYQLCTTSQLLQCLTATTLSILRVFLCIYMPWLCHVFQILLTPCANFVPFRNYFSVSPPSLCQFYLFFTHTHIRTYIHIRTYEHTHTYAHIRTYAHTHAQTHRRDDTQTRRHGETQTRRYADTQTRRHADTQTRQDTTRRQTDKHTSRQADTQTRRHVDTQTRRHADTTRHAHVCVRIHTHSHTADVYKIKSRDRLAAEYVSGRWPHLFFHQVYHSSPIREGTLHNP